MKLREALAAASARLTKSSDTPRLDAELLMAHSLGIEREAMLLGGLDRGAPEAFELLLSRREAGEPVAYIIGRRAFWTIELEVGPAVLIPRPDSETLIEAAVGHFAGRPPVDILDLGTGSGALLLAALDQWREATGVGIDRSEAALAVASANAQRLGMNDRADFRRGDWGEGIEKRFDLILCNPPYVETGAELPRDVAFWEPHEALFAAADGLSEYRRLASALPRLLAPGGIACLEIGPGQERQVSALFEGAGLAVAGRRDLGGHVRCLALTHRV
jgi:release factor glutamine methyltransferase